MAWPRSLVGSSRDAGFPFGGSRAVECARWVAALWAESTKSIVKKKHCETDFLILAFIKKS